MLRKLELRCCGTKYIVTTQSHVMLTRVSNSLHLNDRSKSVPFFILCLSLPKCLANVLQPCGHQLGKGWSLNSPVYDVFMCFCHFPIRCPGSGVVLT